jgi:hypothetical protein
MKYIKPIVLARAVIVNREISHVTLFLLSMVSPDINKLSNLSPTLSLTSSLSEPREKSRHIVFIKYGDINKLYNFNIPIQG